MKKLKVLFLISFALVLLACNDRTSRNRDNDRDDQDREQNRNMEHDQDNTKTKRDSVSEGSMFFSWETLLEQQVDRC